MAELNSALVIRNSFSYVFVAVLLGYSVNPAHGLLLDLHGEKDRHGLSIRLDVSDNECSNLPVAWRNGAASINTLGSCVQLYDEPFCKGSLTVLQPFHTIHQMDLSLINFANRIQSACPCGPKIKTGRFVIQNAADASILTVTSKYGGFARAYTTNTSKVIPKFQQWEILEKSNSEYSLRPREFSDNYPVSFDEEALKKGTIKRKSWKLMSVGRGRYIIKNEPTQRCLYKSEDNKVQEHDCRIWSPNQEWVFREIFGNPKQDKNKGAAVGPGVNYNILSKVAGYKPPTKPPPQHHSIYYNVTTLAKVTRLSTAAPYLITRKIKRGPRPKTRPLVLINQLRPPGLRPAIPNKVSNNNNFLLFKEPIAGLPANVSAGAFVPSDDRLQTLEYYEQVLASEKEREAFAKLQLELLILNRNRTEEAFKQREKEQQIKLKQQKDKGTSADDEDAEEDDESKSDEDSDEEEDKPFKVVDKSPRKNATSQGQESDSETDSGFFGRVYSRVKSGIGSVSSKLPAVPEMKLPSPSLSLPSINYNIFSYQNKNATHSHGEEERRYSKINAYQKGTSGPKSVKKAPHKGYQSSTKTRQKAGKKDPKGRDPQSRRPYKVKASPTTEGPSTLWSYFG